MNQVRILSDNRYYLETQYGYLTYVINSKLLIPPHVFQTYQQERTTDIESYPLGKNIES